MLLTTTFEVPGRPTKKLLGLARGTTIRTRSFSKSVLAFFRGLVGGEIIGYTKVLAEAREQAVDRMVEDAKSQGANAILGIRFMSAEVMAKAAEIVVYGTAAIIEEE